MYDEIIMAADYQMAGRIVTAPQIVFNMSQLVAGIFGINLIGDDHSGTTCPSLWECLCIQKGMDARDKILLQ